MNLILFIESFLERSLEILLTPVKHSEMLWLLIPLVATLILMEIYFTRYEDEELGWNTAFGNSLILIFISASLIRFMYQQGYLTYNLEPIRIAAVSSVLIVGFIITLLDYFHAIPEEVAFGISSRVPINFLSFTSIFLVYGDFKIDFVTAIAFTFILGLLGLMLKGLHKIVPKFKEIIVPEPPESS